MTRLTPKSALRFLRWLLKEELLEEVEGDLEEKFQHVQSRKGLTKARINYWYQVLQYLRPFALKPLKTQNSNTKMLFRHNLTISFRSFKRFKSTFLINLVGLAAGLTSCILISLWIHSEWQVDRFHINNDRLYRVFASFIEPDEIETEADTPAPLGQSLLEAVPGIENYVVVQEDWFRKSPGFIQAQGQEKILKASEYYINGPFFEVFSYELLVGSSKNPIPNTKSVLLSDELAEKLFRNENPIGKSIVWEQPGSSGVYEVSGLFAKPPKDATRQFDLLFSLDIKVQSDEGFNQWNNFPITTYLLLETGVEASAVNEKIRNFLSDKQSEEVELLLQPYADQYLFGRFVNGQATEGRFTYLKIFALIAVFVLTLACINFINLSTAKASNRLKEIGVKKTFGANRGSLVSQYLTESMLIAVIAYLVAILATYLLLPFFNQLTVKELSIFDSYLLTFLFLPISVSVGFVAGVYPAFYLSSFSIMRVIKGKLQSRLGETFVRKGLVVFQFSISSLLILAFFVMSNQVSFVESQSLGFNKENVIQFDFSANSEQAYQSFLTQIRTIPGVKSASGYTHNLTGEYGSTIGLQWAGKQQNQNVSFVTLEGGFDYLVTLQIPLSAGRYFSSSRDNRDQSIIFNKKAVEIMGIKDPIGKRVDLWGEPREIIGVVEDFHFASLYEDIQPCLIRANGNLGKTLVRIENQSLSEVIDKIESVYTINKPGLNFNFRFLDQDFEELYQSEKRLISLSQSFSLISIIISCLGLLGLTAFSIEKREKEMAIRKVLGLSFKGIFYLLSADFLKMVALALVIALPIGFIFLKSWLENFTLSIDLTPIFFIGTGVITILVATLTIGSQVWRSTMFAPAKVLRQE